MWPLPSALPLYCLLLAIYGSLLCCLILYALGKQRASAIAKGITSSWLLALAFVRVMEPSNGPWWLSAGILLAIGFGVLGDILLVWPARTAFLWGMVSFLGGHLAYSGVFYQLMAQHNCSWHAIAWLIPICLTALILLLWRAALPTFFMAAFMLYGLALSTMVGFALQGWFCQWQATIPLACGACCFWLSDLITLRERFVQKRLWHRFVSLPLYYTGQLGCMSVLWL